MRDTYSAPSIEERARKIAEGLQAAFGGWSQIPDHVIDMAIQGHVNNNGLPAAQAEALRFAIEDLFPPEF